jgi:hypothetical protein
MLRNNVSATSFNMTDEIPRKYETQYDFRLGIFKRKEKKRKAECLAPLLAEFRKDLKYTPSLQLGLTWLTRGWSM